jgi:copper ion binding protein
MKNTIEGKLKCSSVFISIPLLVALLALTACSNEQNNERPHTEDVTANENLKTVTIPVEGMTCSACVARVKKSLRSLDGVREVTVSLESRNTKVSFVSDKTSAEQIVKAIDDLGYKAGAPKNE